VSPEQDRAAFQVIIRGRVQGVGFRYSAVREARRLGVSGYVSNTPDGSVEVVAEGDSAALDRLLRWLRTGPSMAHVDGVDVEWRPFTGVYRGFDVEF
jgi:acylphosphatase